LANIREAIREYLEVAKQLASERNIARSAFLDG
jgi:hypothetical protein